ncbi:MAG: Lcl C-terminal domain-containing protein [Methylobacter sp.]
MNYKIVFSSLLALSALACSELPKSSPVGQTIDRFQVQDNVVIDTHSRLMWTRCLLGATWNGTTCEGKADSYGWQQAQKLAKDSTYAGFDDWRVPTLEELKSLADKETAVPMVKIPNINQTVFPTPNCQGARRTASHHDGHSCWQWSSTPIKDSRHYMWIVYFDYGYGSANYEADMFALRLVRNNR